MTSFLPLSGCVPVPLAHYLKALGVLRLVSEQCDVAAVCSWKQDVFRLRSTLGGEKLSYFFLHEYAPTPVIAPWNGGSGFFPKDNRTAITAIEESRTPRLKSYRLVIGQAWKVLEAAKLKDKPDKDAKEKLLRACRNALDDRALAWCDAAFVLGQDGAKYPPLLGTGGNDGRLEFTNNFMQRLGEVFDPATGEPTPASADWLRQSLFAEHIKTVVNRSPIGQFSPGAAGGANSTSGFVGVSFVNPWDYLLMIEGALLFAAASTKKLEGARSGAMSYPFCVRQAGVGYGSASLADEDAARAEMWMPLWKRPVTLAELSTIFGEGRAQVNGRAARNGVDFARAVVTLGVDRGIHAFQRFGFQVRNGLAYFAVPLNRIVVKRNLYAGLITDLDQSNWLERFQNRARGDDAPASVTRVGRELDERLFALYEDKEDSKPVQQLLIALGRCEAAMARSPKWRNPAPPTVSLRPVPLLSSAWLDALGFVRRGQSISLGELGLQECRELRLAAALASMGGSYGDKWFPLRCHLEPVEAISKGRNTWFEWSENASNDAVWHKGNLIDAMNAVFARRLIRAEQTNAENNLPDVSRVPVLLGDIAAFVEDKIDEQRFVDLLWGFSLIDWSGIRPLPQERPKDEQENAVVPSSLYALLKLCFQRPFPLDKSKIVVPLVPAIHRQAMRGTASEASTRAARRLRASGSALAVEEVFAKDEETRRTAAALLFPLTDFWQIKILRQAVGYAEDDESTTPQPIAPLAIQS